MTWLSREEVDELYGQHLDEHWGPYDLPDGRSLTASELTDALDTYESGLDSFIAEEWFEHPATYHWTQDEEESVLAEEINEAGGEFDVITAEVTNYGDYEGERTGDADKQPDPAIIVDESPTYTQPTLSSTLDTPISASMNWHPTKE